MKRSIWAIEGNSQRLDGGAMFGNAPRVVWERWITPDEKHRIPLACRAMLVRESTGRTILFEAGIGVFFPPKLRARFGVMEEEHRLLVNLQAAGFAPEDIDVVVLSHLHFDHAGGLLTAYEEEAPYRLVFPNATYVVGEAAWERARNPHPRDRASFIPELTALLEKARKEIVPSGAGSTTLGDAYRFHESHGHTPGLLLTEVPSDEGAIVYGGDLIPGCPWMHVPITMGYDRYPELVIDEKTALLTDLLARGGRIFFSHDPTTALARVGQDKRGKFVPKESWDSSDELAI